MRETNGNFDSCNSCERLFPSRLHELHESKFPFVPRIEFIRSKLSNFSAHVSGVNDGEWRRHCRSMAFVCIGTRFLDDSSVRRIPMSCLRKAYFGWYSVDWDNLFQKISGCCADDHISNK